MFDRRSVQRLQRRLKAAGPAGGDERSAHGEQNLQNLSGTGSCADPNSLTDVWFSEPGPRQGDVSAQEQHPEGALLPPNQIGK